MYTDADWQRFVSEPDKTLNRSEFARDRARILHSVGLRRLAAKTQVLALSADFPRTRLTHTLEVGQISREMGYALGLDPDLCDLAGLGHDLGHPPFGHNGEEALNEVAASIGGFEGNAQSFRVLTRLEAKISSDSRSYGLNLTRASLDSIIKYPTRTTNPVKFNVYDDDLEVFNWVRLSAPPRRCLEAQVMDWADDVAYSVHDLEDGIFTGLIKFRKISSTQEASHILDVAEEYSSISRQELAVALKNLVTFLKPLQNYDHSPASVVALKEVTSGLIGKFVTAATQATLDTYTLPFVRYQANLVIPTHAIASVAVLKAFAYVYLFSVQTPERIGQRALLKNLVEVMVQKGVRTLDPFFVPYYEQANNDDERFRVIIDQVASLTDHSVLTYYDKWCS